jgi:hypothetical protein
MYVLEDSKGEKLALRPEATASVVRSFIQHKLHADPLMQKFYAIGPMFRHERPQKGRYRQFHQIDVEAFGIDDPMLDAEVMYMLRIFLERVGLTGVVLHINSLVARLPKGLPQSAADYLEDMPMHSVPTVSGGGTRTLSGPSTARWNAARSCLRALPCSWNPFAASAQSISNASSPI